MRLSRAADRFNDMIAADAYAPTVTFLVQFEPVSYSKLDGVQVRKRSTSIAPDVVIPARGVIAIDGQNYLVGHTAPDYWKGRVIRRTVVIQGADGLAVVSSITEALGNSPGVSAYASAAFGKYNTDMRESSAYHPEYQLFFAGSESLSEGTLVSLNGDWFLVKEAYHSTSGLLVGLADKLPGTVFETVTVNSNTYDPVLDAYTTSAASAKVMRVRWKESFEYLAPAQEDYLRGDETVFVLQSAFDAKPSDTLTLSDGDWRVISVVDQGAVLALHARRD